MKGNELGEMQRELVEIRKLLRQINISSKTEKNEEDDDYEFYEDQAELGFFGTNILNVEPETNLFEKIDKEGEKMKDPDKEVEVILELSDEVIVGLSLQAHKRKITLNDLISEIIQESLIDETEKS
jgi:predicted HicB family RNase H-like nuclease